MTDTGKFRALKDFTERRPRDKSLDFPKLIEELKALKARCLQLEHVRIDDKLPEAVASAMKTAERRARTTSPEELLRVQQEARHFAEADAQSSKALVTARYEKLDVTLLALADYVHVMGAAEETQAALAAREAKAREVEAEAARKLQQAEECSAREARLSAESEGRRKDLDRNLANLDIVRRAADLDALREDLEGKLRAYEAEMAGIVRQREELNLDFDKLGEKRAELDAEAEMLQEERKRVKEEKQALARAVARDMAAAFEKFIVQNLSPGEPGGPK